MADGYVIGSYGSDGMKTPIEVGATYAVRYPFARDRVELPDWDGENCGVRIEEGWRPGVIVDRDDYERESLVADGTGEMLLTVISIHKPGKYPERVFYTRQWRDPDGKAFGVQKLRMTTTAAFMRLLKGYRHAYYNAQGDVGGERGMNEPDIDNQSSLPDDVALNYSTWGHVR